MQSGFIHPLRAICFSRFLLSTYFAIRIRRRKKKCALFPRIASDIFFHLFGCIFKHLQANTNKTSLLLQFLSHDSQQFYQSRKAIFQFIFLHHKISIDLQWKVIEKVERTTRATKPAPFSGFSILCVTVDNVFFLFRSGWCSIFLVLYQCLFFRGKIASAKLRIYARELNLNVTSKICNFFEEGKKIGNLIQIVFSVLRLQMQFESKVINSCSTRKRGKKHRKTHFSALNRLIYFSSLAPHFKMELIKLICLPSEWRSKRCL